MLQLKSVSKTYGEGECATHAVRDVTLDFRHNEFVSILGPSGCGKTTLLNIIGGLDRQTKGGLFLHGRSTRAFSDHDWDMYRNRYVGFVFQNYYLIPHQTVLQNVELALTIAGVPKAERRRRAQKALADVGLAGHMNKKPNQLSGGQMQRVAIARALINDPRALLADEPTGALDTETSVQVMELLKKIAEERMVIMVTHNPELAERYSTRVIRMLDGKVVSDSSPLTEEELEIERQQRPRGGNGKRTGMRLTTSYMLSLKNLISKRKRTLLTSFAGSIGIIGISLIVAITAGTNAYIRQSQEDALASSPLELNREAMKTDDLTEALSMFNAAGAGEGDFPIVANDLKAFKTYLDAHLADSSDTTGLRRAVSGVHYDYGVIPLIYTDKRMEELCATARKNGEKNWRSFFEISGMSQAGLSAEMLSGMNGEAISPLVKTQYDLIAGDWPAAAGEVVLILDENGGMSDDGKHALGLDGAEDAEGAARGLLQKTVATALNDGIYSYDSAKKTYVDQRASESGLMTLYRTGTPLKAVGIIRVKEGVSAPMLSGVIGYTNALTRHVIAQAHDSAAGKAQRATPTVDIFTGKVFAEAKGSLGTAEKVTALNTYVRPRTMQERAAMYLKMPEAQGVNTSALTQYQRAKAFNDLIFSATPEKAAAYYDILVPASDASYAANCARIGLIDEGTPSTIRLYAASFEDKETIQDAITAYNDTVPEEQQIVYSDYIGTLLKSVTTIVDAVSAVLIAFVAISLIVSSLMIGIITLISVQERTREIGILRAVGASKKDISGLFNAETVLIGLASGIIGVVVSELLCIPITLIFHRIAQNGRLIVYLPISVAIFLLIVSALLTLIAGVIPSRSAARKNPVDALRVE